MLTLVLTYKGGQTEWLLLVLLLSLDSWCSTFSTGRRSCSFSQSPAGVVDVSWHPADPEDLTYAKKAGYIKKHHCSELQQEGHSPPWETDKTGALTFEFINININSRIQIWSPSLRQWRQQMLTSKDVAGSLYRSGEPLHSLWGALSWSCPLMRLLPWPWTLGKRSKNEDWDHTPSNNDGLLKDLDSLSMLQMTEKVALNQNASPQMKWVTSTEFICDDVEMIKNLVQSVRVPIHTKFYQGDGRMWF